MLGLSRGLHHIIENKPGLSVYSVLHLNTIDSVIVFQHFHDVSTSEYKITKKSELLRAKVVKGKQTIG